METRLPIQLASWTVHAGSLPLGTSLALGASLPLGGFLDESSVCVFGSWLAAEREEVVSGGVKYMACRAIMLRETRRGWILRMDGSPVCTRAAAQCEHMEAARVRKSWRSVRGTRAHASARALASTRAAREQHVSYLVRPTAQG